MKLPTCRLACTLVVLAVTALHGLAQATYEPYTFTTLAGSAALGNVDGEGSTAQFNSPSGVAVDSAGNVYVADLDNHVIRKITPAGVVTTLSGLVDQLDRAVVFDFPKDVALDRAGNLYVLEDLRATVWKVTPAGVATILAGPGVRFAFGTSDGLGSAARFYDPQGLTVDSADNVYVADTVNRTIRKVTPAGVVTTLAGLAGNWGSADGTGNAAWFNNPGGMTVDRADNLYVADAGDFTIRKVTSAGVVTTLAGLAGNPGSTDGTGSAARFNKPGGMTVDSADNLYVADAGNYTIRKVTPAGVVTTLAGLAGGLGNADGTGSGTRFGALGICGMGDPCAVGPIGVAVDSAGNLYVADTGNNTIRKGYLATFILTSRPGFGINGGHFGFNLTGPAGQSVVVEASTDLVNWSPIWTNTFAGGLRFSDPQSAEHPARLYRLRVP